MDGLLWDTAHAQIAQKAGAWLRRNGRLAGQVESLRGKYLLSGFLACGICNGPLIATQRGRNLRLTYVCKAHKEKGDSVCVNSTGGPMDRLHAAVIVSVRETLANAIAAGSGTLDVLLSAIKERQAEREAAELRLAELESTERDLRAESDAVERLRAVWKDWAGALDADPVLARQLLRKVLVGPILVLPKGRGAREFLGGSRFDALLHGALAPRADAVRAWSPAVRARQVAALRAEFPAAGPLGASA